MGPSARAPSSPRGWGVLEMPGSHRGLRSRGAAESMEARLRDSSVSSVSTSGASPSVSHRVTYLVAPSSCPRSKDSGATRDRQKSGSRRIPRTNESGGRYKVTEWLLATRGTRIGFWALRSRALLALAVSADGGETLDTLCRLSVDGVVARAESMQPGLAWYVTRWLGVRGYGPGEWVECCGSKGKRGNLSWSCSRVLQRAGLPGWRISQLCGPRLRDAYGRYLPT